MKYLRLKNSKFKQDLDTFLSGQVHEAETHTYLGPRKETWPGKICLRVISAYVSYKCIHTQGPLRREHRKREEWLEGQQCQQYLERKEMGHRKSMQEKIAKKPCSTSAKASRSSNKVRLESGNRICRLGPILVRRLGNDEC